MFKWLQGRQQGSTYFKLPLLVSEWLKLDVHLIRIPKGGEVKPHLDASPSGYKHWRLNITLWAASKGGVVHWLGPASGKEYEANRIFLFRPDLCTHYVSRVDEGFVLLFSVGWLRRY